MGGTDVWKATVLAGISLALLLPAFNALNTSHIEGVEPPVIVEPPIPPTHQLPDERPQPDKTDDETDAPPLPADCGPSKTVPKYHDTFGEDAFAEGSGSIEVPPYTEALGIRVSYASFIGEFSLTLSDSRGVERWNESARVLTGQAPRTGSADEVFPLPDRGPWTLAWATTPAIVGGGSIDVALRLPCGGLYDGA